MKLNDYRHADCTLFRIPPLNIALLSETISKELLKAWRRGDSADQALNTLLYDKKILRPLISQIEDPLKFQKELKLKEAKEKREIAVDETKREYKHKISQAEQEYNQRLLETQQNIIKAEQILEAEKQDYSASSASLESMRQRVQEKVNALGGKRTLNKLLEINDLVLSSPLESKLEITPEERGHMGQMPQISSSSTLLTPSVQDGYQENQKEITQTKPENYVYNDKKSEKEKTQRQKESIFKKFWKILNYKLW